MRSPLAVTQFERCQGFTSWEERHFVRNREADSPSGLPWESTTNNLYVPAVAGAAMDVASPAALVMVPPAVKLVVPAGANHTDFDESPLLLMGILAAPAEAAQLAGNT